MLYFANPVFLWLLLLVPVIPVVYAVMSALRRRRIKAFGDRELVEALMPSRSVSKGWWKIILFDLALAFFLIGLSRPLVGAKLTERETKGAEIMICLDVSNSMLAQDYTPDRLSRAKLAISRLVDKLQGDRIGLVVFAGTSFVQLPITTDYVSAKLFHTCVNSRNHTDRLLICGIHGRVLSIRSIPCIFTLVEQSDIFFHGIFFHSALRQFLLIPCIAKIIIQRGVLYTEVQ